VDVPFIISVKWPTNVDVPFIFYFVSPTNVDVPFISDVPFIFLLFLFGGALTATNVDVPFIITGGGIALRPLTWMSLLFFIFRARNDGWRDCATGTNVDVPFILLPLTWMSLLFPRPSLTWMSLLFQTLTWMSLLFRETRNDGWGGLRYGH
jgi:hypothetical protein